MTHMAYIKNKIIVITSGSIALYICSPGRAISDSCFYNSKHLLYFDIVHPIFSQTGPRDYLHLLDILLTSFDLPEFV